MLSTKDLTDIDYQVKTEELVKEVLFFRQYGTPASTIQNKNECITQEDFTDETFFD